MGWLRWLWRFAFGEGVTSALRWLTLYLVVLGVTTAYALGALNAQTHRICEESNTAREEAVQIGAEALIEVATEADDELVSTYRKVVGRRLDEATVEC